MKKLLLALSLLVMLAPVALAEDAVDAETLNVELPAAQAVDSQTEDAATAEALDGNGLPISALDLAIARFSSNYECPPGQAYCWQDSQCDASCGPGAGACTFGCCRCSS